MIRVYERNKSISNKSDEIKVKDIVLSREHLIEIVWCYDYTGDTNIVDVFIRHLRIKIEEPFDTIIKAVDNISINNLKKKN